MGRINFDLNGQILSVDGSFKGKVKDSKNEETTLTKTENLQFLKEESYEKEDSDEYWSLHNNDNKLNPLIFSNGKNQRDITKDCVELIKQGTKVIFINGACGSGKSAIALNIARALGKTSIVVPVKNLQKQYEEDYFSKKHLIKKNGKKLKIAVITGRENHDSIYKAGVSCADPSLPENIKINERNYEEILAYYHSNPLISQKEEIDIEKIRRITIAPSNPYWSPIMPAEFELTSLKDAKKRRYTGCDGREYIFYHRKEGCSYYDQYLSYISADVIIYNSAKYLAELSIGRKPQTEVEIIDEADEFLDNLFKSEEINLTRFISNIKSLPLIDEEAIKPADEIIKLSENEEKNKRVLGIDEDKIFKISETNFLKILKILATNKSLEYEILVDETNYSNKIFEFAKEYKEYLEDIYVTFRKEEENIYAAFSSINLSARLNDILKKSKAIIFMSGTIHSEAILKNIFKIKDFKIIDAETNSLGSIEIIMTGQEFDCKYSNFSSGLKSREDYLRALSACFNKAPKPSLIHVNAFNDLPNEEEKESMGLFNSPSSKGLKEMQEKDKKGELVESFKKNKIDSLFTTKCVRGVDFPGDMCRSIIFTKYPNPNIKDAFWRIFSQTYPQDYWNFYRDKAGREFLQRIYRGVRSKNDHVFILSPDIRVIESIKKIQREEIQIKAN